MICATGAREFSSVPRAAFSGRIGHAQAPGGPLGNVMAGTGRGWLAPALMSISGPLGSLQQGPGGNFLPSVSWAALSFCATVQEAGILPHRCRLMPQTRHPLDASWGLSALGYFAPARPAYGRTWRASVLCGAPCHQAGYLGVIPGLGASPLSQGTPTP